MDRIDIKILNLLQKDNRISNQDLAEAVGLSPPACLKRVRKLRSQGIIMADVAIVNPEKVGHRINVIVEVEIERDQLDIYDQFSRKMNAAPEVSQCYQVTGEIDFVLVVLVPDIQAYEAFARRELASNPHLRKFRSLISLRREKFKTEISL
ncbi:transcriptional regulator, AsnC family [Oceanospirillum multiglobuliferum]|uniref:ArsR family transcriptional regulator n=1 Tax=Oceanospirillum multiglobuliferum TaxID=64969 RepID=A0A1T4PUP3_9GAMM|nr:Lrp/AsnC family transcriptional regulator [Oceanospirillum multiglobuliferum]OPX55304.1 ArsR family transcriptional regulator [Oceanospirillum multiglobuliferum]SJZ95265.1 transcriptional regulator, AsnC family [Oceanospirillum multiglobuliferum]